MTQPMDGQRVGAVDDPSDGSGWHSDPLSESAWHLRPHAARTIHYDKCPRQVSVVIL